jgi:alkylation response protein AidB-like acyl-CoA dehydrogenase
MEIASTAVDLVGPAGALRDREVEKLMRDAKLLQIYEGTSDPAARDRPRNPFRFRRGRAR